MFIYTGSGRLVNTTTRLRDPPAGGQARRRGSSRGRRPADAERRKTDDAIERYLLAFEAGTLPEDKCGERVRALADRAAALRTRHAELTATLTADRPTPPTPDTLATIRERVRTVMTDGDTPTRKAVVQELVEALVVTGRDHIQPYYRLPNVTAGDATQVLTMTTRVPRQCSVSGHRQGCLRT